MPPEQTALVHFAAVFDLFPPHSLHVNALNGKMSLGEVINLGLTMQLTSTTIIALLLAVSLLTLAGATTTPSTGFLAPGQIRLF